MKVRPRVYDSDYYKISGHKAFAMTSILFFKRQGDVPELTRINTCNYLLKEISKNNRCVKRVVKKIF